MAKLKTPTKPVTPELQLPIPIPERMWTAKDTAKFLGINVQHVYKLIKDGELECDYIGHWLFHPHFVNEFAIRRQKKQIR